MRESDRSIESVVGTHHGHAAARMRWRCADNADGPKVHSQLQKLHGFDRSTGAEAIG